MVVYSCGGGPLVVVPVMCYGSSIFPSLFLKSRSTSPHFKRKLWTRTAWTIASACFSTSVIFRSPQSRNRVRSVRHIVGPACSMFFEPFGSRNGTALRMRRASGLTRAGPAGTVPARKENKDKELSLLCLRHPATTKGRFCQCLHAL